MNKNQVKGEVEQAKGAVKEVLGKSVGNESLESEGIVQKTVGKVQSLVGDVQAKLKSKL